MIIDPTYPVCRKPWNFSFIRSNVVVDIVRVMFGLTPSGLFSLRLAFELSTSESLRDVRVTRIGDTFPTVFRRLYRRHFACFLHYNFWPASSTGATGLSILSILILCVAPARFRNRAKKSRDRAKIKISYKGQVGRYAFLITIMVLGKISRSRAKPSNKQVWSKAF